MTTTKSEPERSEVCQVAAVPETSSKVCTLLHKQLHAANCPPPGSLTLVEAGAASQLRTTSPPQHSLPAAPTGTTIESHHPLRQNDDDRRQLQLVHSQTPHVLGYDPEFALLAGITHPSSGCYFSATDHHPSSISTTTTATTIPAVSDSNNNSSAANRNNNNNNGDATFQLVASTRTAARGRAQSTDLGDSGNMVLQSYDVALNGSDNVSPYAADYAPTSSLLAAASAAAAAATTLTTTSTCPYLQFSSLRCAATYRTNCQFLCTPRSLSGCYGSGERNGTEVQQVCIDCWGSNVSAREEIAMRAIIGGDEILTRKRKQGSLKRRTNERVDKFDRSINGFDAIETPID
uniref:Uncharacterized protein n=1 Tax=Anopheles atroparvus TaxID=41427 RepID=A0A182J9Z2_ANOAO